GRQGGIKRQIETRARAGLFLFCKDRWSVATNILGGPRTATSFSARFWLAAASQNPSRAQQRARPRAAVHRQLSAASLFPQNSTFSPIRSNLGCRGQRDRSNLRLAHKRGFTQKCL